MRPVDVQISIPRTAEVARVNQIDQQQNQARQQEMVAQSQINTEHFEKTVRKSEASDHKRIEENQEREKEHRGKNQGHDAGDQDKPEAKKPAGDHRLVNGRPRGHLDILA